MKDFTNSDTLKSVYYGLVQPHFDYCCEVWNSINRGQSERLQKLHNRCARIIMNFKDEPGPWKKGENILWPVSCLRLSIIWHHRGSHKCSRILTISTVIIYEVQIRLSFCHDHIPSIDRKCFRYSGVKIWNSIPEQVRNSESLNSFNRNISSVSLTN